MLGRHITKDLPRNNCAIAGKAAIFPVIPRLRGDDDFGVLPRLRLNRLIRGVRRAMRR
jgi:hypothetical protein